MFFTISEPFFSKAGAPAKLLWDVFGALSPQESGCLLPVGASPLFQARQ